MFLHYCLNIRTWCSLCFDKSSCWCSSCKFDIHINVVDACLIFIPCSYYIYSDDFLVFILIHISSHPPFVLEILNTGIVGVSRHALQLAFSFLFFVVHIVPFFSFLMCIKVKLTTKGLIIETLCISLNVCLDNHMKPFAINFQCKRWPWCQELNSLLVVHITLNCSFNCS